MDVVWLLASFAVILSGALLFTNAIEWSGHRLGLGEGATGSLLAAVGTAMPETLIPIVAIIGGGAGADDVAVGAIIGAPFLLAPVAGDPARGRRVDARPRPALLPRLLLGGDRDRRRPAARRAHRARRGLRGRLRRLRARDPARRRRRAGGRDDRAALYGPRSW